MSIDVRPTTKQMVSDGLLSLRVEVGGIAGRDRFDITATRLGEYEWIVRAHSYGVPAPLPSDIEAARFPTAAAALGIGLTAVLERL